MKYSLDKEQKQRHTHTPAERSPTAPGVQQYEKDQQRELQQVSSHQVQSKNRTRTSASANEVLSCKVLVLLAAGLLTICTQSQCTTVLADGHGGSSSSSGVIYDSQCPIQSKLFKAVWMGFRDTITSDAKEAAPLLFDVRGHFGSQVAEWIYGNRTGSLVSLLDERALGQVLNSYDRLTPTPTLTRLLRIILPRKCVNTTEYSYSSVRFECLKMGDSAIASALLHRILKVGTKTLIPIIDSSKQAQAAQLSLLKMYKTAIESAGHELELQSPIIGVGSIKKKLLTYASLSRNATNSIGLLILARGSKALIRVLGSESSTVHHTFSPYGAEEFLEDNGTEIHPGLTRHPSGVYTLEFAGSTEWDNPARRRILVELSAFIGPHPLILTAVLAYDAAARAVGTGPGNRLPLTGPFDLTAGGTRANGVFFGITPKPTSSSKSLALLLQPSDFILQDMLTLMAKTNSGSSSSASFAVVNYQVATSSMLSQEELFTLAMLAQSKYGCKEHGLEVTTHDPFNQLAYSFNFLPESLPAYLLIPNQYGYGLELSCQTGTKTTTSILIACTPNGQSLEDPVHCFRSNPHQRTKRHAPVFNKGSTQQQKYFQAIDSGSGGVTEAPQYYPRSYYYPYTKNYIARDDNANNLYYQPPAGVYGPPPSSSASPPAYYGYPDSSSVPPAPYYGYPEVSSSPPAPYYGYPDSSSVAPPAPYYGAPDSSTAGYYSTPRLDVPISEEPPSSTPAPGAASKLPELRQVLKAAKPFVGSCVGSTTGCAVCVLVLGRLPLGAVPAACTGPCFVGTFGSCGSLLGRVFAETTIICTELFKQGHLDIATFIADAEFGRLIAQQSPETLKGYQFLATPLVHTMQTSAWVTRFVAKIAKKWANHMQYVMGHNCNEDWLGEWIHWVGSPLCWAVGHSLNFVNTFIGWGLGLTTAIMCLLIGLVLLNRKWMRQNVK